MLSDWAATNTGYKTSKTRRAATVGRVIAFLDNVAEVAGLE
jgi:hypothetical protein